MKSLIYKTIIIFLFSIAMQILNTNGAQSQYMINQKVDSVVSLVSQQQIIRVMRELTGDTITLVGGVPRLIFSRLYSSPANNWAAEYIFEKFQSYGLNSYYHVVDSSCKNVIAIKPGTKYPNQKFIVCAHYDNILMTNPSPFDTIYGADDNASGVCAVLEAARLLANMSLEYTLVFAAWDNEERGLLGSIPYADTAYAHSDSIKGVINLDMIAYDTQSKIKVYTNNQSMQHAELFVSMCNRYIPDIEPLIYIITSLPTDITSFYHRGYQGISPMNYSSDPYYHTINDKVSNMSLPYCTKVIKAVVGSMATYGINKQAVFYHDSIPSTYDTSAKVATVVIKFPVQIPFGTNAPRMYYKINNNSFVFTEAFYRNLDTFKFIIPSQFPGSVIAYYFAVQDSAGTYISTYPRGGNGLNPPGTTPPRPFVFNIYFDNNQCSNTLPKPINDFQLLNDTIQIAQTGKTISKIKVNLTLYHTDDGDLTIQLKNQDGYINLSQENGSGGANYINTTFDDSAFLLISQGTPPFTGLFRPQSPLSFFNGKPASGNWILRIFDSKAGNTGTLVNWCLLMQLKNTVQVKENNLPLKFELFQNYPNPFNPSTSIRFRIAKAEFTKLIVYDMLGKVVSVLVNEKLNEGEYEVVFKDSKLSSGVYFYRLSAGEFSDVRKMMLLK